MSGELRTNVLRARDTDGGMRIRTRSRPSLREPVQELFRPVHGPATQGGIFAQGTARAVGEGEGEVVGRLVLERRLFLQVRGFHDIGGGQVLYRKQPEETTMAAYNTILSL